MGISKDDFIKRIAIAEKTTYNEEQLKRIEKALDKAHEIRKFEVEMYWKRANHFWIFIAAVYGTYGFSFQVQSKIPFAPIGITIIAIITSCAWYFANEGGKFWQENWEKKICVLEDYAYGPLYKTVGFDKVVSSYSVSKLNFLLSSLSIIISWYLFLTELNKLFSPIKIYDFSLIPLLITSIIYVFIYSPEIYNEIKKHKFHLYRIKIYGKLVFNLPCFIYLTVLVNILFSEKILIVDIKLLICIMAFIGSYILLLSLAKSFTLHREKRKRIKINTP